MITDKQFDDLAQKAHFFGAACFIFALDDLWHAPGTAFVVLVFAAVLKEFWYDYKYEDPEVRGSSMRDFGYYIAGAGNALAVLAAARLYEMFFN